MEHVISADGTSIALRRQGSGDPVVIVNGALSTADDAVVLAEALAARGYEVAVYDRRARHDSGDTKPYAPEREAEDLRAVIDAVGGAASVVGHSSGAVLALVAASLGAPITRLVLSEPPFRFDASSPEGLPEALQTLVDDGDLGDAVAMFQLRAVGLPEELVEMIRASPMFAGMEPLAQSTVYDATLTEQYGDPTAAMLGVSMPVAIVRGKETFPFLVGAADRLAGAMPNAQYVVSEELRDHRLDPEPGSRIIDGLLRSME